MGAGRTGRWELSYLDLGAEIGEPLEGSWGNRAGRLSVTGIKILNKNPQEILKGIPR